MTYGLVTAISFRDIPKVMRNAARMYRLTALDESNKQIWLDRGDNQAKIWDYASSLLEQSAAQLELRIAELRPARARLAKKPFKPKRERLRK